ENDDSITFGAGTPGETEFDNNDYASSGAPGPDGLGGGTVVDADPRIISNLIVDQTLENPATIAAAVRYAGLEEADIPAAVQAVMDAHALVKGTLPGSPAHAIAQGQLDSLLDEYGSEMDGPTVLLPNVAPDEGLSASYISWFTLFGQF